MQKESRLWQKFMRGILAFDFTLQFLLLLWSVIQLETPEWKLKIQQDLEAYRRRV
jgi:hypothetical protein